MNKSEGWRDVVGYEGLYQVSNLGRVRSVNRRIPHKRFGSVLRKGKMMAFSHHGYGYQQVQLWKDGRGKTALVHRLVAEAWLGPCPDGYEVCHGCEGFGDNSVDNLSYGSRSRNALDRRRDGTHLGKGVVRSDGEFFINSEVAAEATDCHACNIRTVCRGGLRTAGGFGWKWAPN